MWDDIASGWTVEQGDIYHFEHVDLRRAEAMARLRDVQAEFEVQGMLTDAALAGLDIADGLLLSGHMFQIVPLARRKAERTKAEQRAKDALAEIDSIGVQVKDLDIGLLDFPCEVEGRKILLCWKLGEKSITHWHGVEEGFAGRKPIDARIARAKRVN